MNAIATAVLAAATLALAACQQADSSQAVPGEKVYFGNPGVREEMAARLGHAKIQYRVERDGGLWFRASDGTRVRAIQHEVLLEVHLRATGGQ